VSKAHIQLSFGDAYTSKTYLIVNCALFMCKVSFKLRVYDSLSVTFLYTNNICVTLYEDVCQYSILFYLLILLIHSVLIEVDKSGTCCYIHVDNKIKAFDLTRNVVSLTKLT
jgi:hypothetical protein